MKVIGSVYNSSNWVEHTYPGALYLCIKYIDNPELSMTASVNLGGDSSNRTALIGAVMGNAIRSIGFHLLNQIDWRDDRCSAWIYKNSISMEVKAKHISGRQNRTVGAFIFNKD